ncbi:50S ribosomal L24 [Micractinium conductrix]|uniref:50S ribosomal L24 n=1 Tax=Micractinium conductrix TaxID=554055 RepID=A0A2P6VJX6_9CHLO|nr:50S ribosomal L24 [Micractinium conductrix]|eukprot:PSC74367.1 50S ribosomal L24 [Micractinium conductrix]
MAQQAAAMAAAALSVRAPFVGSTRPFAAAPAPRASMPARGLVIRAAIVGPGKKWEHMDLNANGKPQRFQMHIRLGDTVKVIAGSDKGTVGTIVALNTKHGMVTVEGVNIKTKHVKPTAAGEEGQILKKEFPVHHSNVAVYSTAQQTHSRVGFKMVDGKKVRFLKKTGEVLPERIPERKPAASDSSEK